MAGHNKWTQIKRQKAVADSKKSKVFSKYAKIIALASRRGADPATNPELRTAIEKAKAENVSRDIIERAIASTSVKEKEDRLESVLYEAYGPGGTAIIIDVLTDNKNRTVAEIKHLLAKHGAKFAEQGSVLWAFDITAQKIIPKTTVSASSADNEALAKLIEALSVFKDIQKIYTNSL